MFVTRQEQIHEFLRTQSKGDDEDSENKEIDDFPPLGSRVCRRIPFASAGKGSEGELGTVTKHMSDGKHDKNCFYMFSFYSICTSSAVCICISLTQ